MQDSKNYFLKIFLENSKLINFLKVGSCILSKILEIKGKYVLLDSNLKSFSYMKKEEVLEEGFDQNLLIGKYVKVLIESLDNDEGFPVLSVNNYYKKVFWNYLKFSLKKKTRVFGKLLMKIKGGFTVSLNKLKCFLPFSEVDKKLLLNFYFYKNKTLSFNVISFNSLKNNIILSRKSLIYNFLYKKKIGLINFLKTGYIVKGIVKGLASYGIYIDLGYIDGLILLKNTNKWIHKSANELVELNQTVECKVLKVDNLKNKVFLGIKQLYKNPWLNIYFKYKIGSIKYVRIFRITNDIIYVIFELGVLGFYKKSRLLKKNRNRIFLNKIKVNDYILVKINHINFKKKNIGFDFYFKKKTIKVIKKIIKIKKINYLPPLAQ